MTGYFQESVFMVRCVYEQTNGKAWLSHLYGLTQARPNYSCQKQQMAKLVLTQGFVTINISTTTP